MLRANYPVVFFDDKCNLCDNSVQFIIRHDKKDLFRFATLQSELGEAALKKIKLEKHENVYSVILFYKDKWFVKSDAVLHILKLLGGFWKLSFAAIIIPRFIRNTVYNFISKNRYKWFGKKDQCMMPTPELEKKFLS